MIFLNYPLTNPSNFIWVLRSIKFMLEIEECINRPECVRAKSTLTLLYKRREKRIKDEMLKQVQHDDL